MTSAIRAAVIGRADVSMSVYVRRVGFFCLAAALLHQPRRSVAAEPDAGSSPPAAVALLDYRETTNSIVSWSFYFTQDSKPFSKEPEISGRKVSRGTLDFSSGGQQGVPCLWDYREGKLYLDLNKNRDLTDDPEGVFSTKIENRFYFSEVFTNVPLPLNTPAGESRLLMDLHLYNPEASRVYVNAMCRSFWEGKISLQGRDWQVGRIEGDSGTVGRPNAGYLLLRPWEERDRPFELHSGSLDAFSFSDQLFLGGQGYRVECAQVPEEKPPKYRISFGETGAQLAGLNLTGKFIRRVVMIPRRESGTGSNFTVVLNQPAGLVKVPVGHYANVSVELRAGGVSAYRLNQASVEVAVGQDDAPVLAAGGPLTNSVRADRRGRQLSLAYELVGADGANYMVVGQNRADPPSFTISKNGKTIHSGKFEFG